MIILIKNRNLIHCVSWDICADRIAAIPGDCKSPALRHRWFESNSAHIKKTATAGFLMCAEQVRLLICVVGLEALLPYLRIILIMNKWERDTAPVRRETRSDPTRHKNFNLAKQGYFFDID